MVRAALLALACAAALALPACGLVGPGATPADPAVEPLAGTAWRLEAYGDPGQPQQVIPGSDVTLTFAEREVGGSAGCNIYGGNYTQRGDMLTIGEIASTLRACVEQDRMEQERQFLSLLLGVERYERQNGQLELIDRDGKVLRFRASS